jgi:hypothetical protein
MPDAPLRRCHGSRQLSGEVWNPVPVRMTLARSLHRTHLESPLLAATSHERRLRATAIAWCSTWNRHLQAASPMIVGSIGVRLLEPSTSRCIGPKLRLLPAFHVEHPLGSGGGWSARRPPGDRLIPVARRRGVAWLAGADLRFRRRDGWRSSAGSAPGHP